MVKKNELIFSVDTISDVVKTILESHKHIKVITLQGTLGVGKTTFAIELLRQLGIIGELQSPTYTYLQAYKNNDGKAFYHFDLYRLQDKNAFLFAGFDEFLYQSNSLVIVEWPEIIESLLDTNVCAIELSYYDENKRKIKWSYR